MNFFLVDLGILLAANLAFAGLIVRHRHATAMAFGGGAASAASRRLPRNEVRSKGNKRPPAPTPPPGVQYVDPTRLVNLR